MTQAVCKALLSMRNWHECGHTEPVSREAITSDRNGHRFGSLKRKLVAGKGGMGGKRRMGKGGKGERERGGKVILEAGKDDEWDEEIEGWMIREAWMMM